MQNLNINYLAILATAQKGINRTAVFLGLGVNAADAESLKEYRLTKDTSINLLPLGVNDATLQQWKGEFRVWVIGCGFRELVDHMCVFLDQIYHVSSLIAKSYSDKNQSDFERLGLDKKISGLEETFAIRCSGGAQLATFYPVRNCFVHRLGHVGLQDAEQGRPLVLRYMRFASIFVPNNGPEQAVPDIFDPNSPPFITPSVGTLGLKWTEEVIRFALGERVILAPKVLTEVLLFSHQCTIGLIKSAEDFARANGVQEASGSSL